MNSQVTSSGFGIFLIKTERSLERTRSYNFLRGGDSEVLPSKG